MKAATVAFASLIWLGHLQPSVADSDAVPSGYIEVDELELILQSRNVDRIVEAMNTIKAMHYKFPLLKYLNDIWNNRQDNYPQLPWNVISQDIVRLEIADVLLQAERNEVIDVDTESMHDFARARVVNEDGELAFRAISVLAILDRPADVDLLVAVARDPRDLIFRSTILALSQMCNGAAAAALDRLEKETKVGERLEFLVDTRQSYITFNERTHRCG